MEDRGVVEVCGLQMKLVEGSGRPYMTDFGPDIPEKEHCPWKDWRLE
jgi:hypothetical protein